MKHRNSLTDTVELQAKEVEADTGAEEQKEHKLRIGRTCAINLTLSGLKSTLDDAGWGGRDDKPIQNNVCFWLVASLFLLKQNK